MPIRNDFRDRAIGPTQGGVIPRPKNPNPNAPNSPPRPMNPFSPGAVKPNDNPHAAFNRPVRPGSPKSSEFLGGSTHGMGINQRANQIAEKRGIEKGSEAYKAMKTRVSNRFAARAQKRQGKGLVVALESAKKAMSGKPKERIGRNMEKNKQY